VIELAVQHATHQCVCELDSDQLRPGQEKRVAEAVRACSLLILVGQGLVQHRKAGTSSRSTLLSVINVRMCNDVARLRVSASMQAPLWHNRIAISGARHKPTYERAACECQVLLANRLLASVMRQNRVDVFGRRAACVANVIGLCVGSASSCSSCCSCPLRRVVVVVVDCIGSHSMASSIGSSCDPTSNNWRAAWCSASRCDGLRALRVALQSNRRKVALLRMVWTTHETGATLHLGWQRLLVSLGGSLLCCWLLLLVCCVAVLWWWWWWWLFGSSSVVAWCW
jgi:hypothetical protein